MAFPLLRVGIAQIDCALGDLDGNTAKHIDYIERARAEGIELLLFPELSLTGYAVGPGTPDMSIERDDPRLKELARASGPMISVLGFMEEAPAAQFHNSAIALANGDVTFLHRKLNLATYGELEEGKHFAEGRYFETFDVNGDRHWKAGILICADAWNPALVNLAAVHGTTLLMLPIASAEDVVSGGFDNPAGWDIVVNFYAMIYGLPTLMANHTAGASGLKFWGGSRIVDPHGRALARAGAGEELIAADLDYRVLRRTRYNLPTLRDSNLDLVIRELNRLSWQIGIPPESRKV